MRSKPCVAWFLVWHGKYFFLNQTSSNPLNYFCSLKKQMRILKFFHGRTKFFFKKEKGSPWIFVK